MSEVGQNFLGGDNQQILALTDFASYFFVNGSNFRQNGGPVGIFVRPRQLYATLVFPLCRHASGLFFHNRFVIACKINKLL